VIATQADLDAGLGGFVGDIVWFKPERLTSGRRDALQIFMGGASGAGFALVWQEDPEGVRPGKFAGPGHGWSGATTNHKTDIWYSHISWGDFAKVDLDFVTGGDPEHELDVIGRPKALVPMALPIRLSDNDVVNAHNILVELDDNGVPLQDSEGNYTPVQNEAALSEEGDGTHRYATVIPGFIDGWYDYINYMDELKTVAYTADGRLLDGDTGASRANLFLQPYVNADGKTSAWAIINYEETKGAGNGPPEDGAIPSEAYLPEQGKNVIYHTFDFKTPDLVSGGPSSTCRSGTKRATCSTSWTGTEARFSTGRINRSWLTRTPAGPASSSRAGAPSRPASTGPPCWWSTRKAGKAPADPRTSCCGASNFRRVRP